MQTKKHHTHYCSLKERVWIRGFSKHFVDIQESVFSGFRSLGKTVDFRLVSCLIRQPECERLRWSNLRTFQQALDCWWLLFLWDLLELWGWSVSRRSLNVLCTRRAPLVLSAKALRPMTLSFWFSTSSTPWVSKVRWSSDSCISKVEH